MSAKNGEPNPELRAHAKRMLRDRAARLLDELALPGVPVWLVAREIVLLLKAGIAYCGKPLFEAFWEMLVGATLGNMGFCQGCESQLEPEEIKKVSCKKCEEAVMREFGKDICKEAD